jgi:hypothetical protein
MWLTWRTRAGSTGSILDSRRDLASDVGVWHGGQDTITSSLLQNSMEMLHLELGMGQPFVTDESNAWSELANNSWSKHLWQ